MLGFSSHAHFLCKLVLGPFATNDTSCINACCVEGLTPYLEAEVPRNVLKLGSLTLSNHGHARIVGHLLSHSHLGILGRQLLLGMFEFHVGQG